MKERNRILRWEGKHENTGKAKERMKEEKIKEMKRKEGEGGRGG